MYFVCYLECARDFCSLRQSTVGSPKNECLHLNCFLSISYQMSSTNETTWTRRKNDAIVSGAIMSDDGTNGNVQFRIQWLIIRCDCSGLSTFLGVCALRILCIRKPIAIRSIRQWQIHIERTRINAQMSERARKYHNEPVRLASANEANDKKKIKKTKRSVMGFFLCSLELMCPLCIFRQMVKTLPSRVCARKHMPGHCTPVRAYLIGELRFVE